MCTCVFAYFVSKEIYSCGFSFVEATAIKRYLDPQSQSFLQELSFSFQLDSWTNNTVSYLQLEGKNIHSRIPPATRPVVKTTEVQSEQLQDWVKFNKTKQYPFNILHNVLHGESSYNMSHIYVITQLYNPSGFRKLILKCDISRKQHKSA